MHLRDVRSVVLVESLLAYVVPGGGLHVIERNENEKTPRISSALIHFDHETLAGWKTVTTSCSAHLCRVKTPY